MWRRGEAGCTSTRPVSLTADKHVNCSLERGGRFIVEKVGKLVLGRCA